MMGSEKKNEKMSLYMNDEQYEWNRRWKWNKKEIREGGKKPMLLYWRAGKPEACHSCGTVLVLWKASTIGTAKFGKSVIF